jgi:hypothetical protein
MRAEVLIPVEVILGFLKNTKCPLYKNGIKSIIKSFFASIMPPKLS